MHCLFRQLKQRKALESLCQVLPLKKPNCSFRFASGTNLCTNFEPKSFHWIECSNFGLNCPSQPSRETFKTNFATSPKLCGNWKVGSPQSFRCPDQVWPDCYFLHLQLEESRFQNFLYGTSLAFECTLQSCHHSSFVEQCLSLGSLDICFPEWELRRYFEGRELEF